MWLFSSGPSDNVVDCLSPPLGAVASIMFGVVDTISEALQQHSGHGKMEIKKTDAQREKEENIKIRQVQVWQQKKNGKPPKTIRMPFFCQPTDSTSPVGRQMRPCFCFCFDFFLFFIFVPPLLTSPPPLAPIPPIGRLR